MKDPKAQQNTHVYRFAFLQQHKENEQRILNLQLGVGKQQGGQVGPLYPQSQRTIGREQQAQEVLAYGDSLYFNPPEENQYGHDCPTAINLFSF